MNTFQKFLLLCSFINLISACSENKQTSVATHNKENAPTIINIGTPEKGSLLGYSRFASSVDLIPLEDNDDCIISSADKVEVTRGGDILIFDRNLRKITRFDSTGHFLNCIAEIGHGPGEIIRPTSMTYDPYTDHVFVIDNGKMTLTEYDLAGELIRKEHPTPFGAEEIDIIDAKHYCFYSDFIKKKDETGFNYHITDHSFQAIGCYEPITTRWDGMIDSKVFMKAGEQHYSRSPESNYIYQISADTITPLYQIEYSGEGKWISEKNADQLREKILFTKGAAHCLNTYLSNKYLIIFIMVPIEDYYRPQMVVYNRENGETITGENYHNDLPNAASSDIHAVYGNCLLSICFPEDFQRINENLQSQIDFYTETKRPMKDKDQYKATIKLFAPFAQKTNVTLQITHLK